MRKAKANLVTALAKAMLEARKLRGFTQAAVASHIGISQGALSKMERGLLVPSAIQWIEFCRMTKIKIDDFMGTTGAVAAGGATEPTTGKAPQALSNEIPH